ncbi:hypothetical protein CORMATOL_01621 [Corynebacterium matruchotii ATCC 33806]|uniref:Uncharacterized protein n=1 Tax=Corynebacterium matruchotii ATCC 33806 TaxID=566549 RepID=C0E3Q6_9CORY|nr:hypothetical protein CORMATOL_01621 [Corynebacterium matruchotii ATCC 33806]
MDLSGAKQINPEPTNRTLFTIITSDFFGICLRSDDLVQTSLGKNLAPFHYSCGQLSC